MEKVYFQVVPVGEEASVFVTGTHFQIAYVNNTSLNAGVRNLARVVLAILEKFMDKVTQKRKAGKPVDGESV